MHSQGKQLLLKLLPGFLPLVVFIIADEVWGTTIGLYVAIAFGLVSLVYIYFKERRFDKFVLFDTLLIVALGVVSIWLENDVFFKLKPALIGVMMCALMGISVFTPKNLLIAMMQRYMGQMELNHEQYLQLNRNFRRLFYVFVVYTGLVFYSVWFMSTEAWAFISGAFLYIVMGGYFLFELIRQRIKLRRYQKYEWLPLVDTEGKIIGKATRHNCHTNKALLHPVVHLHIFNSKGELYLQKRPMHKLVQPGKWDTAVGGHIDFGEELEKALWRESAEELGITNFKPDFVTKYIWESNMERELVFVFTTKFDGPLYPNSTELDGGRFWAISEIKAQLGKAVFTTNFEHEFNLLKPLLKIK
jgi:isopentenyldiphosphate isomerase/intracellular septation protein A